MMGILSRLSKTRSLHGEDDRWAYNRRIESMRMDEYPMLRGTTYLDHGGTTLANKSMLESFCKSMQKTLLANPHSDASNPSASSIIVSDTRQKVLEFFKADPEHFDIVFTANATAAIKLVMECLSGHEEGFNYLYHRNAHTSLVGVREVAHRSHCFASDAELDKWLRGGAKLFNPDHAERPTLFAYPGQSNMNGQRLPLSWPALVRSKEEHSKVFTLLDAAALVSTGVLDLSDHESAPDFVALSFYKIFGFPDLGALIVRKASAHVLEHRKYFGGGTTDMITVFEESPWVARKLDTLHSRLEDGTIAIRSILALRCALDAHHRLFSGMQHISKHTAWLAKELYGRLSLMTHDNGVKACEIYKADGSEYGDATTQGATVVMNVRRSDGTWVSANQVGSMLRTRNIQVRTGSLCNPAGMAQAMVLEPGVMRKAYAAGYRCYQQEHIVDSTTLFGMVRITLGAMNTMADVELVCACIEELFIEHQQDWRGIALPTREDSLADSREKSTTLQPTADVPSMKESSTRKISVFKRLCRMVSCFA